MNNDFEKFLDGYILKLKEVVDNEHPDYKYIMTHSKRKLVFVTQLQELLIEYIKYVGNQC